MGAYRNDLGTFASETLALADIVNKGWDNGGNPRNGMYFYDSTALSTKFYRNGAWILEGNAGSPASFSIHFAGLPAAGQLITIGGNIFEWDGVGANINVVIAGTAEGCLDNLLAAWVASGVGALLWEKLSATELRITNAAAKQGAVSPGSQDFALSENSNNVTLSTGTPSNLNTLAGQAQGPVRTARASLAVVAGMVVATNTQRVRFPFTVVRYRIACFHASGALFIPFADTFTLANGDVVITFNAGGAADLVAGDIVHVEAWSA